MINVKDPPYNAVGDGVADDTEAIQAAVRDATDDVCFFPKGTYLINTNGVSLSDRVQLEGNGVLKAASEFGHNYDGVLRARRVHDWSVRDLTIDMGGVTGTGIVGFGCNGWKVVGCNIVGIKIYGIMAQGALDFEIDRNTFQHSSPTGAYSNCAVLVTNIRESRCGYYRITNNRSVGTGFGCSGHDGVVSQNVVTDNQMGAGIFAQGDSERLIIQGNICASGRGRDLYSTWSLGFELWGKHHVVTGNISYDNDGGGMAIGAKNSVVASNLSYNNGRRTNYAGITARYLDDDRNASGSIIIGNRCFDSRPAVEDKTQGHGFAIQSNLITGLSMGKNNFEGNKFGAVKNPT